MLSSCHPPKLEECIYQYLGTKHPASLFSLTSSPKSTPASEDNCICHYFLVVDYLRSTISTLISAHHSQDVFKVNTRFSMSSSNISYLKSCTTELTFFPIATAPAGGATSSSPGLATRLRKVAYAERLPTSSPLRCDQASHRQGRRLCACRAIHEGHTRDTTVRLFKGEHPDPGPAGRRPE